MSASEQNYRSQPHHPSVSASSGSRQQHRHHHHHHQHQQPHHLQHHQHLSHVEQLNVNALGVIPRTTAATTTTPTATTTATATATVTVTTTWPPNPSHYPTQLPVHPMYAGSSPATLHHHYTQAPTDSVPLHQPTSLPPWMSAYARPELQQWSYYSHQNQLLNLAQSIPVTHQETPFSDAPHSSQPSTSWQAHQQFPRHTASALAPGMTDSRQNSPSASSWPGVSPGEPSSAAAVFSPPSKLDQAWTLPEAQSGQGAYPHGPNSIDRFESPSTQLTSRQRQKKTAKVPSSFVERQKKAKVSRRSGPLQDRQREKTHAMRKTKRICVRCKFYKSGCDEGDPCEKCNKITGHARSFREPCYREHLEDTSLVRRCNGREHQAEAEFLGYDWIHNSQLYEMEIFWNLPRYGPIGNAQPLRVTFRPYNPKRGPLDVAASMWTSKEGNVRQLNQPAYAIYDTANLVPAFERYFSSLQPAIEEWIFSRIRQDEVALLTYHEVVRMRNVNGSKALDLAMRLQCLSVVSQGYGSVLSDNIAGIREYDYRALGRSDYEAYDRDSCDRPLPGAITHQMDVAAIKCMARLEKAFIKELAALIFQPKIKPWYELFLTLYVIFWNLEYIHQGAQNYIKSKTGTSIAGQVSNVVTTQIKKWEFSFPILLYHWRITLRGFSPFKIARDNPEELRVRGHVDQKGFQYVTRIASLFDRARPDRFQPPLTGFAASHWSTSSAWIINLFKEAGA